jgi:hypothetical protein
MCQLSDGEIEHISADQIPDTLDRMIALPTLGTNVKVTVKVHDALTF